MHEYIKFIYAYDCMQVLMFSLKHRIFASDLLKDCS